MIEQITSIQSVSYRETQKDTKKERELLHFTMKF